MDGSVGFQGEYVLKFKAMLESLVDIEIILEDERLTSTQANKVMLKLISVAGNAKAIDKLAATLILQSYLDRKRT